MNQPLLSSIYRQSGVDISAGALPQHELEILSNATGNDEGLLSCYLKRRLSGEPLAYIIGHIEIEFDGIVIPIGKRAYITDPEAIYLVNHLKSVLSRSDVLNVLEVGTGCGSLSFGIGKGVNGGSIGMGERNENKNKDKEQQSGHHVEWKGRGNSMPEPQRGEEPEKLQVYPHQ